MFRFSGSDAGRGAEFDGPDPGLPDSFETSSIDVCSCPERLNFEARCAAEQVAD